MKKKQFDLGYLFIHLVMLLILVITLFPFLNVIAMSFSSEVAVRNNPFMIIPSDINLSSYRIILTHRQLYSAYYNTIVTTLVSTAIGLAITIMAAYSLSRPNFPATKGLMVYFMITMYIHGGMIPNFLLIKDLGLYDSLWALILPGAMSVYNMILMKNFFTSADIYVLTEAAKIDGANEPQILTKIVIPASKAAISTIMLFYMVSHWNSFMNAVLYTRSSDKWTLQLLLREIVLSAEMAMLEGYDIQEELIPYANVKAATMLVTILPIMVVYPFIQKYFVKGVMVGAVKG